MFLVVVAVQKETSLTLHDQTPGEHQFKVTGVSSSGEGPESALLTLPIATAAAA